jgi:hypothetical protein
MQIGLPGRDWERQIGGSKSRVQGLQGASTRCRDWERHIRYFHGGEADEGGVDRADRHSRDRLGTADRVLAWR